MENIKKPKMLYNVVQNEYKFRVKWDEATITTLTIHAETETSARMKIESMASIAKFEILEMIGEDNDDREERNGSNT